MGKLTRNGSWLIALACMCAVACGDDDGGDDAGTAGGAAGSSGSAGMAGSAGASGASGRGGSGGRGPTAGMMAAMCSEPAPTGPVMCGGQVCTAPTFMNNQCVYPCCATVNGAQVCGAKSTNPMFPTECEPAAVPDPSCPPAETMGMQLQGCCNIAKNQCGIISSVRPGCITSSMLIMLPDPPLSCSADDAGVDDAGI